MKYGQSAVLTFTYMVSDGIAQVPQTVTVTVAGRNDAPVEEGAIVARTHEDAGTFTLNLLAGATDVDGDSLSVSGLKLVSGQSVKFTQKNGILSLDSNQFNALAVGQSQELLFTYLVSDGKGGTVAQNASVTVEGRNDAPVIKAALKASVTEDAAPLSVNLLSGASDVDGDTLSVSSLVQSGGPTASFSVTDGQLRLDPGQFNYLKSGQSAVLTFSYMVSDGIARVPQTVTVTVSGVNDGPVVAGAIVARTNEDAGTFTLNLLAGATDVDGDSLSVSGLKLVSGQGVKFTQSNGIISLDTNQFNALAVGQSQELVFTYLVSDGKGGTVAQKASVTVEGRNDAPVIKVSNIASGLKENAAGLTLAKVTATDVEGDAITFAVDDGRFEVVNGLLRLKAGASLDYEAQPNGGSVTVTATDAHGASTSTVVGYKVVNVDEPLKAADDSVAILEDQAVTIAILDNDLHASNVRLPTITTASVSHGSVTVNADGALTYVPGANRHEPVVISYTLAEDGKVSSAKVNVTITAQADAPAISFAGAGGNTYAPIALNVTAALVDLDGSESLSDIVIGGLPTDARLSAGTRNANGDWVLSQAQLAGLSVITTKGGSWSLTVSATATEAGNGDSRTTTVAGLLNVQAVPTINADWLYGKETIGDMIYGLPGNDFIDGLSGNDMLYGEAGDDYLRGGAGDDYLYGGAGNDLLEGGGGNDVLYGHAGVNTLIGGDGNDQFLSTYQGNGGVLDGGAGDDVFEVQSGNLTIFGGTGRDTFKVDPMFVERYPGINTILDFQAGNDGDIIDLVQYLSSFDLFAKWDGSTNLFSAGFVRLVESGGSTQVQVDRDASGNSYSWTTLLSLAGIPPSALTAANFSRLYGFDPSGIVGPGISVTSTSSNSETITGSSGNDYVSGGAGASFIETGAGRDVIHGGDGNDTLCPGTGDDVVFAGAGNDVIRAQNWDYYGNDYIDAGDGNDSITDGYGSDTIFAGNGNDVINLLSDSATPDTVDAGQGDDTIMIGGYGGATLTTGSGRDVVSMPYSTSYAANTVITDFTAGNGGDRIDLSRLLTTLTGWSSGNPFGSSGFLRVRQSGADTVIEVDRDGAAKSTYAYMTALILKNVVASTLTADNIVQGFDPLGGTTQGVSLSGTSGSDTLVGSGGNDVLNGDAGNDNLVGADGHDLINGGSGDDYLAGDGGDDVLDGGAGNDSMNGGVGNNWLFGGDGNDYLTVGQGRSSLFGGDGDDTFYAYSDVATYFDGGAGNDTFNISGHNKETNTIVTGSGQDKILLQYVSNLGALMQVTDFTPGTGGDVIDLNSFQQSYLKGWNGQDNPFGSGFLRVVQSGADTLLQVDTDGFGGTAPWQTLAVLSGVQASALNAANFHPAYHPDGSGVYGASLTGGTGNDSFAGTVGDDILNGGGGADVINGGAGRDVLSGGDGADSLNAGSGRDTLVGGTGNDILSGGAGEDLYLFNRGDGADTIVNATGNQDNAADTLRFGAGIDGDDLWFARSGANLEVSVLGSVDKVVLAEWYSSTVGAKVQSLQLADGSTLDQSRVENLVSAMAAFNPPPATQTQLTTHQHQALDTVIAANWQHS